MTQAPSRSRQETKVERAVILELLDRGRCSRADLVERVAADPIDKDRTGKILEHLEAAGVVKFSGDSVTPSDVLRHLDALNLIAV